MSDAGTAALNTGANSGPLKHWVVPTLVALIGAFMSILDTSIVNVAITKIMNVFNTDTTTVQWVSTAYTLGMGVIVPLNGWLSNKIGLKRLYIASIAGFVVGSLLCTVSWDINSLIVARIIQALGGGMIMPTMMSMVFRMVPREKMGAGMGILGIALLVAPALGPTLGGYLVEYVDWRWIFTINLPIGIIGILLAVAVLPELPAVGKVGKLDVGGFITAAGGLFCLLLALSNVETWGWGDERIIMLLYASVSLLSLFTYIELTTEHPLLELRLFKYKSFTMANLVMMITTIGLFAGLFYLPLFLQSIRGLGAMEAGLLMMPGALISGVMMPIVGRLYDRTGPRILLVIGLLSLAAMTYTFRLLSLETSFATITAWILLRGLVMAMANMPANTAAMADIPPHLVSQASAMTNIIRNVSSALGVAALTSMLTSRIPDYAQQMSDQVTPWNPMLPDFVHSFAAQAGTDPATSQGSALAWLGGHIQQIAFVKGIDDIFIVAAILTVVGVIPALFLKKGRGGQSAAPMAE